MVDDFVVARNPDPDSSLPFLVRVPFGPRGLVLKARDSWPRTAKVYCHRATEWPADPEVLERVPVRSCTGRGQAIDLLLDRARENRSQLVFTRLKDGRQVVFWQSPRTTKKARPGVRVPTARASGVPTLQIAVDTHERYPYRFTAQQVVTVRAALPAGDYAVRRVDGVEGEWLAAVERKSLEDLATSLVTGRLEGQLAELSVLSRAAVVVEERYSRLFTLEHLRGATAADRLARVQVRWPSVPVFFAETRQLAQEWTFRFLGAAWAEDAATSVLEERVAELVEAGPLPPREPTTAQVRAWALRVGLPVADRGRLRPEVRAAYDVAHRPPPELT